MRDEEKQTSQGSKWQSTLRKKWVFPAIYIASAALILTSVLWFQNSSDEQAESDNYGYEHQVDKQYTQDQSFDGEEALPVTLTEENFQMPILDESTVFIKKNFYDYDASTEDQESALVFYNNTYYPNTGIDIAMETGESFDVVAALSGTVIKAEKDQLLGQVVLVEHDNGVATHYQSLENVVVEAGQYVEQGEVIGVAGRSVYNQDAGVHVHFEIRKDNNPVNPIEFFNQPISSLNEDNKEVEEDKDAKTPKDGEEEQPTQQEEIESDEPSPVEENSNTPEDASTSMPRA